MRYCSSKYERKMMFYTLSFLDLEDFPFLDEVSVLDLDCVLAPASSVFPSSPASKGVARIT